MVAPIGMSQVVDVAFVLIVSTICLLSLFRDTAQAEVSRKRWKEELKGLEVSLRELIGEACAASNGLDRNLLKRQEELQGLLKKIQTAQHEIALEEQELKLAAGKPKRSRKKKAVEALPDPNVVTIEPAVLRSNVSNSVFDEEDLPNESWHVASPSAKSSNPARNQISSRNATPHESLNSQIEVSRDPRVIEKEIMRSMDPITYRVARRLLESGKEIHVVARKLEIPIADVRQIDRLVRGATELRSPVMAGTQDFQADRNSAKGSATADESHEVDEGIQRRQALL